MWSERIPFKLIMNTDVNLFIKIFESKYLFNLLLKNIRRISADICIIGYSGAFIPISFKYHNKIKNAWIIDAKNHPSIFKNFFSTINPDIIVDVVGEIIINAENIFGVPGGEITAIRNPSKVASPPLHGPRSIPYIGVSDTAISIFPLPPTIGIPGKSVNIYISPANIEMRAISSGLYILLPYIFIDVLWIFY